MAEPTNPHKGRTGIDRLIHAPSHSALGLRDAYHYENAFRQEFRSAAVMLPLALWLGRGWVETSLLAGSVLLVLIVELLNSAVESTVDRVSFKQRDLSRRGKDDASAAVALTLLRPAVSG